MKNCYSRKDKERFMKRALSLAKKVKGTTSPNPAVGAVIVNKNKIIAEGATSKVGGPHAEIVALEKLDFKVPDASDMFVTLEPCSRTYPTKRTEPCAPRIIKSNLRGVYTGIMDVHEQTRGNAFKIFDEAGVYWENGVFSEEVSFFYRDYSKFISEHLPWVTVKYAMSLDGKIATRTGDSKWITSLKSRKMVHKIRAEHDAILVGKNTYLRDNPKLNVRYGRHKGKTPLRILLTSSFGVHKQGEMFTDGFPTLVCGSIKKTSRAWDSFEEKEIIAVIEKDAGVMDLRALLSYLASHNITSILIEGGGSTIAGFIEAGLVDEVYAFIAPKIIGGKDALSPVDGKGFSAVEESMSFKRVKVKQVESDVLIHGIVKK